MKTATKSLVLALALVPLLASQCSKNFPSGYDLRFKVKNNSNNGIYFSENNTYPDSMIYIVSPLTKNKEKKILSGESGNFYLTGTDWETKFKDAPQNSISLFIFKSDSLEQILWDTIRAKYIIEMRYDLTLQNMKDRNWEIEFPYDSTKGKLKVYKR